jgi:small subunit ribosomal protein S17
MAEETENENVETSETPVEAQPEVSDAAEAMSDTAVDETPTEESTEAEAPAEEPEAEAPADEPAAEATPAEATPAPQSEPKKKGKRLPRAERPQKTRPKRERATTRKPISREEKPEHERGRRQERRGVVVSDAMDKTIVVKVDAVRSHPKYKKVIRRSIKFHAHDEQNSAHVGDVVRIVETRPMSKTKHWRLAEIVEVAK